MREIEFRGYNKETQRWYEGMLGKFDNKYFIDTGTGIKAYVEEESVCQYTGFTDINGKKIFEEDVLHWNEDWYGYALMLNGRWMIALEGPSVDDYYLNELANKVEVINNSYEERLKSD